MKTLTLILVTLVVATTQSIYGQYKSYDVTSYGIEVSQFISGSGFASSSEAHFTIQPSAKAKVGMGIFVDNQTAKFSGITITHQRMLLTGRRRVPTVQPYVFYNFIYRKTFLPELKATSEPDQSVDIVSYTSLEHHLGVGFNFRISNLVCLKTDLGYGLYLGSIKRPSQPNAITREIKGTNGGAILVKAGLALNIW